MYIVTIYCGRLRSHKFPVLEEKNSPRQLKQLTSTVEMVYVWETPVIFPEPS